MIVCVRLLNLSFFHHDVCLSVNFSVLFTEDVDFSGIVLCCVLSLSDFDVSMDISFELLAFEQMCLL
uniref:Uncharacterized protein n=1 Tax=Arundo donax TaxID=35708 RepID=A0A0A8YKT0_ARUDO